MKTCRSPTCYYSAVDPETENTALLLEDLTDARQGDSVAGCSMDDAHRAIVHLARFQAAWWDNPRLDDLDWMPLKRDESDAYLDIYPASVAVADPSGRPRNAAVPAPTGRYAAAAPRQDKSPADQTAP